MCRLYLSITCKFSDLPAVLRVLTFQVGTHVNMKTIITAVKQRCGLDRNTKTGTKQIHQSNSIGPSNYEQYLVQPKWLAVLSVSVKGPIFFLTSFNILREINLAFVSDGCAFFSGKSQGH